MSENNRPSHLSDGPVIEDSAFIFSGFSQSEVTEIHKAITNLHDEMDERDNGGNKYLVLGNYEEKQKQRLEQTCDLLSYFNPQSYPFLLDYLDVENADWDNFYLKFRYAEDYSDYCVLVAEDNDGGHELEVGEVPLSELYILKRDYEMTSINHDIEREKFDAMIGTMFEMMAENDRLVPWRDRYSFATGVRWIANQTTSDSDPNGSLDQPDGENRDEEPEADTEEEKEDNKATEDDQTQYEPAVFENDEMGLPSPWEEKTHATHVKFLDGATHSISDLLLDPPEFTEELLNKLNDIRSGSGFQESYRKRTLDKTDEELMLEFLGEVLDRDWIRVTRPTKNFTDIELKVYRSSGSDSVRLRLEAIGPTEKGQITKPIAGFDTLEQAKQHIRRFVNTYEDNRTVNNIDKTPFIKTADEMKEDLQ